MAEPTQDPHPDELYSDLNVLIEMAQDAKQDEQAIRRHLESLKAKLDRFIHKAKTDSRA
jgi:hypothetical protein